IVEWPGGSPHGADSWASAVPAPPASNSANSGPHFRIWDRIVRFISPGSAPAIGLYWALSEKSAVLASLSPRVTDCLTVLVSLPLASFSCHASTSYVPAGRPLIVNFPSGVVTAWNGCGITCSQAPIHEWTSHLTLMPISGVLNCLSEVMPALPWPSLNSLLRAGTEWMLCMVSSLFLMVSVWP